MTRRSNQLGRLFAKGASWIFGLLGGLVWAAFCVLVVAFFYRLGTLSFVAAILVAATGSIGLLLAGLFAHRFFGCYAVPLLELATSEESDTSGKAESRFVWAVVSLALGFAALVAAVVMKSVVAFVGAAFALSLYGWLTPRLWDRSKPPP